jgi:quercetin dioxygenase-like cupin family protein
MRSILIENSFPVKLIEEMEYETGSILSKSIIDRMSGNVKIMSFDRGRMLQEKIIPFDTFNQVIEGCAEIIIEGKINVVSCGQSIIIPAHKHNIIYAPERFKMIQTIIKSGYEFTI